MLPNFLIIGVQKGATTWLANCLGQHPDVFQKIEASEDGPKSAAGFAANVMIVAGPRKDQAFHFADWERCQPCDEPGEAIASKEG